MADREGINNSHLINRWLPFTIIPVARKRGGNFFLCPDGLRLIMLDFFTKAVPTQAYLKAGIMGGPGDGKTYTAALIAIGLHKLLKAKGLPEGNNPIAVLETSEMGVHWLIPMFEAAGIQLMHRKTRRFTDFGEGMRRAADAKMITMVDTVTGFWVELVEAHKDVLGRQTLMMEDWAQPKAQWAETMEDFKNLPGHTILCGRAGFEYGRFENEATGRMDLERTGVRMKAEGDTGYEPSLLIYMKKQTDLSNPALPRLYHTATILKDRSCKLHGQTFDNPTFETFLPHIEGINLGGEQINPVEGNSRHIVVDPRSGRAWYDEKNCVLDEIDTLLANKIPGMSADDKKRRGDLLQSHFGTLSRERLRTLHLDVLTRGYNSLHVELTGTPPTIPGNQSPTATAASERAERVKPALDPNGVPGSPLNELRDRFAAEPVTIPAAGTGETLKPAAVATSNTPENGENSGVAADNRTVDESESQLEHIRNSAEDAPAPPPIRRKRGRPPGSKNKPVGTPAPSPAPAAPDTSPDAPAQPAPDTSGQAPAEPAPDVRAQSEADDEAERANRSRQALAEATKPAPAGDQPEAPNRKRGRPPGSKNKATSGAVPIESKPEKAAAPAKTGPDVGKWDVFIVEAAKAAEANGIKKDAFTRGINLTIANAQLTSTASDKLPAEFLGDLYDAIVEGRWDAKSGSFIGAAAQPV